MDDIRNLNETEQAKIIDESDGFAEFTPKINTRSSNFFSLKGIWLG